MNITVTLLAQIVAFVLLIVFVNKVLWKPLTTMMEARQKRISEGLAAAERGKKEQELAEKHAKDVLSDAKKQAAEIVSNAQKRGNDLVEEAKKNAKTEADRIVAGANAQIEQEVNRAKETLRKEVSAIALQGASKVLKREVDAAAHAKVLDELAAKI
ncbi:MAG: F0F1 ATP synthase subunit B [Gammaproteobacteria bacterium]|nr:F0F1 ATP synthase subunit B [Gammaproteobacteria bacterium]